MTHVTVILMSECRTVYPKLSINLCGPQPYVDIRTEKIKVNKTLFCGEDTD